MRCTRSKQSVWIPCARDRRWTRRNSAASRAYHSLQTQQRVTIGMLYVFIVAAALVGFQLTYVARSVSF